MPETDETKQEATTPVSGPVGLGGWLALPLLHVVIGPAISAYNCYILITEWNLFGRDLGGEDGVYEALRIPLLGSTLMEAVAGGIGLFCLVLMLRRSPLTPKWMIIFYLSGVVFALLDLYVYDAVDKAGFQGWSEGIKQLTRAAGSAVIWVSYFLRSRRVANTFRTREAAVDRRLDEIFS